MDSVLVLQLILTLFIFSCMANILVLLYKNSRVKQHVDKRYRM